VRTLDDTPQSARSLGRRSSPRRLLPFAEQGSPAVEAELRVRFEEASRALRTLEQELSERDATAAELRERWEEASTSELQLQRERLAAEHELQDRAEQLAEAEALAEELRGEAEAAFSDDAEAAAELRAELERERACHHAAIDAAGAAYSAQTRLSDELDALQGIQHELDGERDGRVTAEEALRRARDEAAELAEQLEDKEYALLITSEAAAEEVGGDGGEPIGVREARRLRTECLQLEAELQSSQSLATSSRSRPAMPGDGLVMRAHLSPDLGSEHQEAAAEDPCTWRRSTPSFAGQDAAAYAAALASGEAEDLNPFGGSAEDARGHDADGTESTPRGRVSFAPPPRLGSSTGGANEGGDVSGIDSGSGLQEAGSNPFEDEGAANPFGMDDADSAGGDGIVPMGSPTFGSKASRLASESSSCLDAGSPSDLPSQRSLATPSFGEPPLFIQELNSLRAELTTEEAACAEAREEARGAKRALAEAHSEGGGSSGSRASAEAEDVERLRQELSEETARSRRLGQHAVRAEQKRRRLMLELAEDATADADLAALAQVVARAARAIATISKEAPLLPPDDPPPLSRPGTSAGPAALAAAAAAAAAAESEAGPAALAAAAAAAAAAEPPPPSAPKAPSPLPGVSRLRTLPAAPPAAAPPVAAAAAPAVPATPPRPALGRLPAAPRPEDLL